MNEQTAYAIAGAANQLTGTAQAVANFGEKKNAAERNYKYAREFYDYQYAKNLESWNMTNEYNSPTAQMDRLKQAGLNPNLVYGKGADAMSSSAPEYKGSAPSIPTPEFSQATNINMYQDLQNKVKQNQLLDAQIDAVKQNTTNAAMKELGFEADSFVKNRMRNLGNLSIRELDNAMANGFTDDSTIRGVTMAYQLQALMERTRQMSISNSMAVKEAEYWEALKLTNNPAFNKILEGLIKTAVGGGARTIVNYQK